MLFVYAHLYCGHNSLHNGITSCIEHMQLERLVKYTYSASCCCDIFVRI